MSARALLGRAVLPLTRRLEFPGKRRLRQHVRLPEHGVREAIVAGSRLRLDLRESLHRDYYFGLVDHVRGALRLRGSLPDVLDQVLAGFTQERLTG